MFVLAEIEMWEVCSALRPMRTTHHKDALVAAMTGVTEGHARCSYDDGDGGSAAIEAVSGVKCLAK
jgi:uncharacterized ParB-like nuclease family protein